MEHFEENDNNKTEMGRLVRRVHDSLGDDCVSFHLCSLDYANIMNAYQNFHERSVVAYGKRIASINLMDNISTFTAAALLENLSAMKHEPIEGDPPTPADILAYLWNTLTEDVSRVLSEMTNGAVSFTVEHGETVCINGPTNDEEVN